MATVDRASASWRNRSDRWGSEHAPAATATCVRDCIGIFCGLLGNSPFLLLTRKQLCDLLAGSDDKPPRFSAIYGELTKRLVEKSEIEQKIRMYLEYRKHATRH